VLELHLQALTQLRSDIRGTLFADCVSLISSAPRVFIFGIGPTSSMAAYFAIQLNRIGLEASALTEAGVLFADALNRIRGSDVLVMLAFGPPYPEIEALVTQAERLRLGSLLITDSLGQTYARKVRLVVPVQRGRVSALSLHTATLAMLEALLIGIAAARPAETIESLEKLNAMRSEIAQKHRASSAARTSKRKI
jgi:DNA-binding MurR/RpiR family transcriptional regulator